MAVNLCSTSSVRAVLGVSEAELRDTVLLQPIYLTRLTNQLEALHPDIVSDFAAASETDPMSGEQDRFVNLLQTYSAYVMAKYLVGAAPMFAPKTIKDDRTEAQRVDDPYKSLRSDIDESLPFLKIQLMVAYSKINSSSPLPSATARIRVLASPLGVNPVTG